MPQSIDQTLSAFANTPGDGVIILGVDESKNFSIVGVYDPKKCQQALANIARKEFSAPVTVHSSLIQVGSKNVVWAKVDEADRSLKPIKSKRRGKGFIRLYDGDYELSYQEDQLFIAGRGPSHFDEAPIADSLTEDLDRSITRDYIERRKAHAPVLSKLDDEKVLFRTRVTNRAGVLTTAGAVSLGVYPQQFLPNYSIKVSVQKKKGQPDNFRAVNVNSIGGPIPIILEETLKWVEQNTNEITLNLDNGRVRNVREYPLSVVRELVANALIHRDMNPVSMMQDISLTIEDDRMVISNPGGLYGISVNELGHTGSKTRNQLIAEICQYVVASDGHNVVEKLGSGIPMVLEELATLHMAPPIFIDGGIYLTVILRSGMVPIDEDSNQQVEPGSNDEKILEVLKGGAFSRNELETATKLSFSQVRYALRRLTNQGKVTKIGDSRSKNTLYKLR
jgi:ATP-dependent DNA helicase RecG